MLQSTVPERIDIGESSWKDSRTSLGRGNRRYFVSRLRVGWNRSMVNHVAGAEGRVLKENTGKVGHLGFR